MFFAADLDPPWRFIYLSPGVAAVTGYTSAELAAEPTVIADAISQRDLSDFLAEVGLGADLTIGFRRKSGDIASVHVMARRISHDNGSVTIEGLAFDVTDVVAALTRAEESEEWFRLSFEMSEVGMCIVDPAGQFLAVNDALVRMLRTSESELIGRTWQDTTHPDDLPMDLNLVASTVSEGGPGFRLRKRFLRGDGSVMWGDLSTSVYRDHSGETRLWVSQVVDVTAQVDAEQRLLASEEKYRLLAENSSDVIMHVVGDEVHWASPSLRRSLGWDPIEIRGHRIQDYIHPDDADTYAAIDQRLAGQDALMVRLRVRAANGVFHWIAAHLAAYHNADGDTAGTAVSFRVIDDDVRREEELDHRARFDHLTGLLNREALFDGIAEAQRNLGVRDHDAIGVLFVDLDDFKRLNDTYGHAFGDHILRTVADRVKASVRPEDLVARMGGDELLVVLTSTGTRLMLEEVGQRVRAAIAEPVVWENLSESTTASIGAAVGRSYEDPDQLVARADAAMYVAKQSGRDRVVLAE